MLALRPSVAPPARACRAIAGPVMDTIHDFLIQDLDSGETMSRTTDPPAAGTTTIRHAAGARFEEGLRAFFAYRDLGIREATGGAFGAHVIRAVPGEGAKPQWHTHDLGFQMVYVLKGWVRFEYEDIGAVELRAGDVAYQPPRIRHREIAHSDDVEMLEITAPAEFATTVVAAPAGTATAAAGPAGGGGGGGGES